MVATVVLGLLLVAAMLLSRGRARAPRSLVVALLLALAGLVFMGLPGALILEAAAPAIDLVFGAGATDRLPATALWPAAIYLSLVWPFSLVVGEYLLAGRGLSRVSWSLLFSAVVALSYLLLATLVYLLAR